MKSIETRLVQADIMTESDGFCQHRGQDENNGEEKERGAHCDEESKGVLHAATTNDEETVFGCGVHGAVQPRPSESAALSLTHSSLMPVVPVDSQIFDLAFHPTESVVYTGLLNGKLKAFTYDDQGVHSAAFELRISKRSCRGLALSPDGSSLYAVGKNKTLQCVATIKYNRSLHLPGSALKYHRHRHWSVIRDTPEST